MAGNLSRITNIIIIINIIIVVSSTRKIIIIAIIIHFQEWSARQCFRAWCQILRIIVVMIPARSVARALQQIIISIIIIIIVVSSSL